MKNIKILAISLIWGATIVVACKSSQTSSKTAETATAPSNCTNPAITYNNGLKPILDKNCNTSGCHDASFKQMDFTKYAIIKKFADEGEIKKHVLKIKNMPPNHKLNDSELNAFQCWLDNGAKE
jgi:hypothetical protein